MLAIARELAEAYHRRFVGRHVEALVESRRDRASGLLCGYTPRYVRAFFEGPDRLFGKLVTVPVQDATTRGVRCVTRGP
jgi:tRNA A37 methylthiotransferase MiaB